MAKPVAEKTAITEKVEYNCSRCGAVLQSVKGRDVLKCPACGYEVPCS